MKIQHSQKNKIKKLLVTTIGKVIFNDILPEGFPYLNEPTKDNLETATPDKYFVAPSDLSEDGLKAYIADKEAVTPFKKGFLSKIISEIFNRFHIYRDIYDVRQNERFRI